MQCDVFWDCRTAILLFVPLQLKENYISVLGQTAVVQLLLECLMMATQNHITTNLLDVSQLQLCDVADRVNLGLIPSSEEGWPVACRLLKRKTGGVLHIHQNVTSPIHCPAVISTSEPNQTASVKKTHREVWQVWADDTANRIASLFKDITCESWTTSIQHIEHVKSYAPHIHHVVLDLECRPLWTDS